MITLQAAEELSGVLCKVLPRQNRVAEFHFSNHEWGQAILEALATFAVDGVPLPVDVRQMVEEFVNQDGISPKFRRHATFDLDRIPSA